MNRVPLRYITVVFFVFLSGFCLSAKAQNDTLGDPDKAFAQARELAFSGKRKEGRELALRILQKHPLYSDVKTFVGRTYAWDGEYENARKAFADVAAADPKTLDNYIAWIDAERWADEPANALAAAEKGLQHFSDDPGLLFRKAKLLSVTGKMADAKLVVQKLLRKQPNHGDGYLLLQELRGQLLDNDISAGFSYESFSAYFSPASYAFVQGSRATSLGSIVARVNYADRFGNQSFQPEIDLYPRLFRGVYAYLNAGFSNGDLFPEQRYGAEVFASLPLSLEASAGLRYLSFSPESKVTIYTGSVGFYTGNYWISLRPYITPDSASTSVSASATVRRYFSNPEHYFSVRIGAGYSPELLNTQTTTGSSSKAFYGLRSQSATIGYQHPFSRKWAVNGSLTIGRQEPLFAIGEFAVNTAASLTVRYRYK
ncbi:YaiO family outer membrane beta-barrel protein [Flavisolibacter sp. BT320]|nr:YaiO family outer membrane beta-barrel protein [Flavisolibacter longurius]